MLLVSKRILSSFLLIGLASLVAAHGLVPEQEAIDQQTGQPAGIPLLSSSLSSAFVPLIRRLVARSDSISAGEVKVDQDDQPVETPPEWYPSYRRKAVNSHSNTTLHHFDAYTGYHQFQQDRKDHIKHSKRQHKHFLHGKQRKQPPHFPDSSLNYTITKREESTVARRSGSSGYTLIKEYSGASFFDEFFFYTDADPSGGMIDYVDREEARRSGLIGTRNGHAFMKIGYGNGDGVQKAVRISTQDTFTSGIIVLDAFHMPTGCGVWPSFWTTPKNPPGGWPQGGEIDLVEGVHYFGKNTMSIHAPSWCSIDTNVEMLGKLAMPDKSLAGNCDPSKTNDQGCGVQSQTVGDYGRPYNRAHGGVHVLDWDSNRGIHAYFFPRNAIPSDIEAGNPTPWTWGKPKASWPATNCKPDDYFREHVAVFTNTVCGTWGGSWPVWNNAMNGQDTPCKVRTGKKSCFEYMKSGPDLHTAFWEIKSLKIYQTSRRN